MTKKKAKNIFVKLLSCAGTGFFYVKQRPKTAAYRLTFIKYDPIVNAHVLFKETKLK